MSIGGGGVCISGSCTLNASNPATTTPPSSTTINCNYNSGCTAAYETPGYFNTGVQDIAIDKSGNLYVSDDSEVLEYNSSGAFSRVLCGAGGGSGQCWYPEELAIDASGNIWVADASNSRVQAFSPSGSVMLQIGGTAGTGNGQFGYAIGVSFDQSGNIWAADSYSPGYPSAWIEKFNSTGSYLGQVGTFGSGNGQFNNSAYNMCFTTIDPSGNLWVADCYQHRVEEFSTAGSGTWLAVLGSGAGSCTSCLCTSGSCPSSAEGTGTGQFSYPIGIVADGSGNIWVGDTGNYRLQEFSNNGMYLRQIGHGSGAANGQFEPLGFAFTTATFR